AGNAASVRFDELDVASAAQPGEFDVLVSMNTLYWHPDPEGLVRACRVALVRDGHAVFVTYVRRARVIGTALEVRAAQGPIEAVRAVGTPPGDRKATDVLGGVVHDDALAGRISQGREEDLVGGVNDDRAIRADRPRQRSPEPVEESGVGAPPDFGHRGRRKPV